MRSILGLPDAEGRPSPVRPWAGQRDIERTTGRGQEEVTGLLARLRERWAKSVPAVTAVREDVVAILAEHGRVLEGNQIAAALLMRRGSDLEDPSTGWTWPRVCARAAIDTEDPAGAPAAGRAARGRPRARRPHPGRRSRRPRGGRPDRLRAPARRASRRARCPRPAAQRDGGARRTAGRPAPRARPCPTPTGGPGRCGVGEHRGDRPPRAVSARPVSRTGTEAVAGRQLPLRSAVTRNAPARRPVPQGLSPEELRKRVLARFPDLAALPDAPKLRDILRGLRYDVQVINGRYVIPVGTQASAASTRPAPGPKPGTAPRPRRCGSGLTRRGSAAASSRSRRG